MVKLQNRATSNRLPGNALIVLIGVFSILAGWSPARSQTPGPESAKVPAPYLSTRDQAGHELVKTEQFMVPVGASVALKGLEFEPGETKLTPAQQKIMQQVFNSLEEITENTVGDTDQTRVAALAKMEFEIRGFAEAAEKPGQGAALAESRARAVVDFLTNLGTPPWRLHVKGVTLQKQDGATKANDGGAARRIIFVRIR